MRKTDYKEMCALENQVHILRARVAELEGIAYDYERAKMYISRLESRMANPYLIKQRDDLLAHIAELEATKQWHDESEPPERVEGTNLSRRVEVQSLSGDVCTTSYFYQTHYPYWQHPRVKGCCIAVLRWRDLPTLPEVEQ